MVAQTGPEAPIDVLQKMVNEVLVQTGKLLHNSRKGAPASVQQANIKSQAKIVASHNRFHVALDDLEEQIVRSKSVLMRDLEQLRAERQQPAQPAAPMVIDEPEELKIEEPSPPAAPIPDMNGGDQEAAKTESEAAVAPFPNMGLDVPMDFQIDGSIKEEKLSPQPAAIQSVHFSSEAPKQEPKAAPTPPVSAPAVPGSSLNDAFDLTGSATLSNDELNFTDMMFSLAPTSDSQAQGQSQSHDLDLTSFGSADNLLSLDGLDTSMGTNTTSDPGNAADAAPVAQMDLPQLDLTVGMTGNVPDATAAKKEEKAAETSLDDFFNLDGSTSMDNIDLDLDLDGAGDNTNFDDLFFAGDDTDMGNLGDADAYFGL